MDKGLQRSLTPISCTFLPRRFMDKGEPKKIWVRNLCVDLASKISGRRLFLELIGLGTAILYVNPVFSDPLKEAKEPDLIRYQKLINGVKIQDIVKGEGPEAHEGDLVEFNYVCRRSNGYFVHSTLDQFSGESRPVILPLDGKEIIDGLKDVLVGMKVGGKRRALIPPNVGYVNENLKPIPDEGTFQLMEMPSGCSDQVQFENTGRGCNNVLFSGTLVGLGRKLKEL